MLYNNSPRSILVVSVGYHIIFNDSIVNNCIILDAVFVTVKISFVYLKYKSSMLPVMVNPIYILKFS